MKIKRKDGSEYEPDSLSLVQRGIQRYLNDKKSGYNILVGKEFEQSMKVLTAKKKQLTKLGKGNKRNATRELEQH